MKYDYTKSYRYPCLVCGKKAPETRYLKKVDDLKTLDNYKIISTRKLGDGSWSVYYTDGQYSHNYKYFCTARCAQNYAIWTLDRKKPYKK